MENKTKGQELGEQYAGAMISNDFVQYGLTKREYFAGLAMQGLLAHYGNTFKSPDLLNSALNHVDTLLEKLAEN